MTADELIHLLQLEPLPGEGGLYAESYRSVETFNPVGYGGERSFGTAIYYLLTPDTFSALHRLATDEVYHFYLGDPVEMLNLYPDGRAERVILGQEVLNGQRVQHVVPRGVWQGSRVLAGGSFALMGATMAPGFSPDDYEHGDLNALAEQFPQEHDLISALL